MNNTLENIKRQLMGSAVWKRINGDISDIAIRKTKNGNWGIFYGHIFSGIFLDRASVDINEVKEAGIKIISGTMEH